MCTAVWHSASLPLRQWRRCCLCPVQSRTGSSLSFIFTVVAFHRRSSDPCGSVIAFQFHVFPKCLFFSFPFYYMTRLLKRCVSPPDGRPLTEAFHAPAPFHSVGSVSAWTCISTLYTRLHMQRGSSLPASVALNAGLRRFPCSRLPCCCRRLKPSAAACYSCTAHGFHINV